MKAITMRKEGIFASMTMNFITFSITNDYKYIDTQLKRCGTPDRLGEAWKSKLTKITKHLSAHVRALFCYSINRDTPCHSLQ
jgi:hypothetical protein